MIPIATGVKLSAALALCAGLALGGAAQAQEPIKVGIQLGSAGSDAVLFAEAWRAVDEDDEERLANTAELAEALSPSAERRLETMEQGSAFLRAASAWHHGAFSLDERTPYSVAVAAVCALLGIGCETALAAWLHGCVASQLSAAVRLVPLGQSEGVAVLAGLEPMVLHTAARAAASSIGELGTATIYADIASMRHEAQCSRLFRS